MQPKQMKSKYKNWAKIFFVISFGGMLICAFFVAWVDPYFQYHGQNRDLQYSLKEPDYINPGIAKNWDFEGIMVGTSMTQNFKMSQFNQGMDIFTIKTPFSGGTPKNMKIILDIALKNNPNLQYVFYGADLGRLATNADAIRNPLPEYLYDNNYLNDVNYLLSMDTMIVAAGNIYRTITQVPSTDMDEYYEFGTRYVFGKESALKNYRRRTTIIEDSLPVNAFEEGTKKNLQENIFPLLEAYPNVEFYFFYPPYSVLHWDSKNRDGTLLAELEKFRYSTEQLLSYSNVKVFTFFEPWIICDLDNYMDHSHYSPEINQYMAECMIKDRNRVTLDNLDEVYAQLKLLTTTFDYDSLFE